jgi:hypothetical protein
MLPSVMGPDRFVGSRHRCRSAISFVGSSLNSLAAFSMASLLSVAWTVPSHWKTGGELIDCPRLRWLPL